MDVEVEVEVEDKVVVVVVVAFYFKIQDFKIQDLNCKLCPHFLHCFCLT